MTRDECVCSVYGNLLPVYLQISLCCECQSDGHVTRLVVSYRGFKQMPCMNYQLDQSYRGGTTCIYVAHGLSVGLVPV